MIANHQRARNMKFSADEDTSNDSDSTNHKKQPRVKIEKNEQQSNPTHLPFSSF